MRAVVLAAGRGSRLAPHTEDRPKCLLEIGGRTLLERQTAALRRAGATEVGAVTGWCASAFTGLRLPCWHNPRWERTTMVETLAHAEQWLTSGTTLVSYGDIVYSAADASALAAVDAPLAVAYDPRWRALWERRFADPLADAETFVLDRAGHLADIGGRPKRLADVQGQYMGLHPRRMAGSPQGARRSFGGRGPHDGSARPDRAGRAAACGGRSRPASVVRVRPPPRSRARSLGHRRPRRARSREHPLTGWTGRTA